MRHLLIVAETNNYLLMSISEKLISKSYDITISGAGTDSINNVKARKVKVNGILIHADECLACKRQALHFISDWAGFDDIPVFIIGKTEELNAVKAAINEQLVRGEFCRPVNVNNMVEVLDGLMEQFGSQARKKILAVDDSGTMLRTIKSWFEGKYNVSIANSGAMAVKYLFLNRPDLVLLDYEMPICDGRQVLEMMRGEEEFADIPVIFLTCKSDKESIMNVMDLKPNGYLLKSMSPARIVEAVDNFFERNVRE